MSPYKDGTMYTNLTSMIERNSHDYPEIKLDPKKIFFSGSEDSPEKMDIISTKFSLEMNLDQVFQDAFLNCQANSSCSDKVYSLIKTLNLMSDEILTADGVQKSELNKLANEWLEDALYDPEYNELYREIYDFYKQKINNNNLKLEKLEKELDILDDTINVLSSKAEDLGDYNKNVKLLAEANKNLTDYNNLMEPII